MSTPHQILKEYFGYDEFRTGQKEIIESIINDNNVLAVMPTGSGKSICYQIPALMKENISIVISPLISLMQDQVEALNKNRKIAAYINSSLDYSTTEKVLFSLINKEIKLLYLAPEKLNNIEFVEKIKNLSPEYIFIDEAHCISEWGHNFRPSYRNIESFAKALGINKISAFTATATPEVRDDIIAQLNFQSPSTFVYGFERDNLFLNVIHSKKKKQKVAELLKKHKTKTIIYTSTRKNCEELSKYLNQNSITAEHYHAGLTTELRKVIQDDFIKDNIETIVATNAFGMGIDKEDIGMVIHYNIPASIENLYQEFGRAGRNGKEAYTYLLYSEKDKYVQDFLISLNNPTVEQIQTLYTAILDFYQISLNSISEKALEISEELQKLLTSKSINPVQVNSALNNLELNGYLKVIPSNFQSSSFKFNVTQTKLKNYIKKLHNRELKEFLLDLVQFYGARPFGESCNIRFQELQKNFSISKQQVEYHFDNLEKIGIVEFEKSTYLTRFQMLRERVKSEYLNINYSDIERKIEHSKEKLDAVIEYSYTDECRFKYILKYFGELVNNYWCGKCDNCLKGTNNIESNNEYLNEIILRTFKEFNGLTSQRLVGILRGKSKSTVAKSISTYGSCMHYSTDEILNGLTNLIRKNMLKEIEQKIFFDPIEDLEKVDEEIVSSSNSYESNLELFNNLREERKLAAKKFSQHPDIICSDRILKLLAQQKPTSPSQFLSVDGTNQRMFNKIGQEFLEIIKDYRDKEQTETKSNSLPKHITQTYQLIKKGYSLQEITNLLKLPESIVSIQIESIIDYYPEEKFDNLLEKEEFKLIHGSINDVNEDLKLIKERLPSSISYAKIRVVNAILKVSQDV